MSAATSAVGLALPLADPIGRAAVGAVVASLIAVAARRAGALTHRGAAAAIVTGTLCTAAGLGWGAMLIGFFLTSTALGRIKADLRARRIGGIVAKGGARDARQVLANGGLFAGTALGYLAHPSPLWMAMGGGALAAAAADTWATEIGTLARQAPRHVLAWHTVPPGTSGGVTVVGLLASVAGAALIGGLGLLAGWPGAAVVATVLGGVAGGFADSLLGAAVQARRWCDRCTGATEQPVHVCGSTTRFSGGVPWIDNDAVNLLSVALGGAAALILFAALPA